MISGNTQFQGMAHAIDLSVYACVMWCFFPLIAAKAFNKTWEV